MCKQFVSSLLVCLLALYQHINISAHWHLAYQNSGTANLVARLPDGWLAGWLAFWMAGILDGWPDIALASR